MRTSSKRPRPAGSPRAYRPAGTPAAGRAEAQRDEARQDTGQHQQRAKIMVRLTASRTARGLIVGPVIFGRRGDVVSWDRTVSIASRSRTRVPSCPVLTPAALFYPRPFPFVLSAHICADSNRMTGSEFERQVRAVARPRGVIVSFDVVPGKVVRRSLYGDRFTTLKDRKKEIGPGLLKAMLDQLGLTKEDLDT